MRRIRFKIVYQSAPITFVDVKRSISMNLQKYFKIRFTEDTLSKYMVVIFFFNTNYLIF